MALFLNRESLLRWFDVQDERQLSRLVYKTTNCGAWAAFHRCTELVKVEYAALLELANGKIRVLRVTRDKTPVAVGDLSGPAKDFLLLAREPEEDDDPNQCDISPDDFFGLKTETYVTVESTGFNRKIVRFSCQEEGPLTSDGLRLGSIVEGSDIDCDTHTLMFPFTLKQFNEAIEAIERQAEEMWNEANAWEKEETADAVT